MYKSRDFVHLHVHTDFSLQRGAIKLKPLAEQLKKYDMKACAITDYANMFGAVSFYNTMKANEIHPVLGYEANLTFDSRFDKSTTLKAGERPYYHIVLLAKDFEGYLNLCYLASRAYTEGFLHKPRIDIELLAEKSKGLIALSSGTKGAIGHFLVNNNFEKALENAKTFEDIFGKDNFYIEVSDHDLEEQKKIRDDLFELSKKSDIPLVATNDAHYMSKKDSKAHEILMCIGDGKTINDGTRTTLGTDNFYLRSTQEMWDLFGNDLPDALKQTCSIAEMCNVEIPLKDNLALPVYPIPADSKKYKY